MTHKQRVKFFDYVFGDDLDFYEKYIMHLCEIEQRQFFEKNPNFMSKYPVHIEYIYLLHDDIFRGVLRMIRK